MKTFILISGLLVLGSCSIVKNNSQEALRSASTSAPYDAIIVPGVPFEGNSWQTTMQIRVMWANFLYKNGYTNNIIYSGGAVHSAYSESKVMALYGIAMGIPSENVYLDTLAEHSTENVYFSLQVAKEAGFKRIALATDPFQANSLRKFISKHELPIDVLPIVFDTISTLDHTEPEIDSQIAFTKNFVSLKNRESFFTRLAGTMGKQIQWHRSDLSDEKLIRKYERQQRILPESDAINVSDNRPSATERPVTGN